MRRSRVGRLGLRRGTSGSLCQAEQQFGRRVVVCVAQGPVTPVRGGDGLLRYELQRIWGHRPQGPLPAKEYLVQWKGYDTSQMTWEARASLLADVPTVLLAYEKSPTTAQARASAPTRAPTMMTTLPSRRRSACLAAS